MSTENDQNTQNADNALDQQVIEAQAAAAETIQTEEPVSGIVSLFAGEHLAGVRISPRLIIVLMMRNVDAPKIIPLGETHYSVESPLRKGDGSEANPAGIVRATLPDVIRYLDTLSGREIIFMGSPEDFDAHSSALLQQIVERASELLYSHVGDGETLIDGVHASESFAINGWMSSSRDEAGVILHPNVGIHISVPALVGRDELTKPLHTMVKIVNNYGANSGLGANGVRIGLAFDATQLMNTSVLEALQKLGSENDKAAVLSYGYMARCAEDIANDVHSIFPVGGDAPEAMRTVLPFSDEAGGGDTLFLM